MRGHLNGILKVALAAVLGVFCFSCDIARESHRGEKASLEAGDSSPKDYRRIISLAPSITEILFELDLGDRTVGATTFCDYPPQAQQIPRIGGYSTPNYEAIVGLRPDLVILLNLHREAEDHLRNLGISTLSVDHDSVKGVLESIRNIGSSCGQSARGDAIAERLLAKISEIRMRVEPYQTKTVLLSVGRHASSGSLSEVFVAGSGTFLDQLIDTAGGVNVVAKVAASYPKISLEGIFKLDPEIIIDMIPELKSRNWDPDEILSQWLALDAVGAVKNGRVTILSDEHVLRPGPRFVLTVEQMARAIHPEAFRE